MSEQHTEGCQILLVDSAGRILLQLRDDIPTIAFPGRWALPGGMLEPGEEPRHAVRREVEEEMGIRLADRDVVHVASARRSYGTEHTYTARVDVPAEEIALTEGQRVAWFDPDEAQRLDLAYEDGDVIADFVAGRTEAEGGP